MITGFYASICTLLIIKLTFNVVALRRQHKVRLGNGGHSDLETAIRIHGNAIEYIPITLILMALLELSGAAWWLLHPAGIALLTSRILHAVALKNSDIKQRVLGMKIMLFLLLALSAANIGYFGYHQYLGWLN